VTLAEVVIGIETGTAMATVIVTEMDAVVTGIETVIGMAAGTIVIDVTCPTIGIATPATTTVTITTDSATAGMIGGIPITGTSVTGTSTRIVRDQATGGRGVRRIG